MNIPRPSRQPNAGGATPPPASSRASRQPNAGGNLRGPAATRAPDYIGPTQRPARTGADLAQTVRRANTSGFTTAQDAFNFGFNPKLKALEKSGVPVLNEQKEKARLDARGNVIAASTGGGDFQSNFAVATAGISKPLVFLGLAGAALVAYSVFK